MWSCSAGARKSGFALSCTCPTASHLTIPSATCSPGWTQSSSSGVSWSGVDPDGGALLPGEVVAIDGKTVRRSHNRSAGKQAIHLVSAWASANTLTLGQVKGGAKVRRWAALAAD